MLLPVLVIGCWLTFRSVQQTGEEMNKALAAEMGERIRDRIVAVFAVPQQVIAFNVALAQKGLMDVGHPDQLLQQLLLQIRQQPLLTFISVGSAEGEYFSASRPPLGEDKSLRIFHARINKARQMHMYRVDSTGKSTSDTTFSRLTYDARLRPWFSSAVNKGIAWYPTYRYAVGELDAAYDTLGIGMSAALFDAQGQFVGVTTADVALLQLSEFLQREIKQPGSVAFIAEEDGTLLATSNGAPLYSMSQDGKVQRYSLRDSSDALLQAAGRAMTKQSAAQGSQYVEIGEKRHLLHWQHHHLAQGPRLVFGVITDAAPLNKLNSSLLDSFYYLLALSVLLLCMPFILASDRLARALNFRSATPAAEPGELNESDGIPSTRVMEAPMEAASPQLCNSESERRFLLTMASHEFRTPAAMIKASLDSLRFMQHDLPAEVEKRLDHIRLAAARLNDLSNTLITHERIIQQSPVIMENVDVQALLSQVLAIYPAEAGIELALTDHTVTLPADPVELRVAIQNLIDNALAHNPLGDAPVRVFLRPAGKYIDICIADGGVGIPDSEKDRVFEPYYNLSGQFARGIGLAIVRSIACKHSGRVHAEDNKPSGTIMVLSLPLNQESLAMERV